MEYGPLPEARYPIPNVKRTVFLKAVISNPAISVGEYTYYDDPDDPSSFEKNVLYHFDFIGDKLVIGKFCQIATGVKFIMNGANHRTDGFSTYPFVAFGQGWSGHFKEEAYFPFKGDTVIGNDVWIGYEALLMPGVSVGDGAVIATRSVVVDDVPPYAVVAGNPARVVKMRFDEMTISSLLNIRWWDWDIDKITQNIKVISQANLKSLEDLSE
ncbi:MAG: CatB-related O-acetyltransferase [Nitrospinota bacterium]